MENGAAALNADDCDDDVWARWTRLRRRVDHFFHLWDLQDRTGRLHGLHRLDVPARRRSPWPATSSTSSSTSRRWPCRASCADTFERAGLVGDRGLLDRQAVAASSGANDFGSLMIEENVPSGGWARYFRLTEAETARAIQEAGFVPGAPVDHLTTASWVTVRLGHHTPGSSYGHVAATSLASGPRGLLPARAQSASEPGGMFSWAGASSSRASPSPLLPARAPSGRRLRTLARRLLGSATSAATRTPGPQATSVPTLLVQGEPPRERINRLPPAATPVRFRAAPPRVPAPARTGIRVRRRRCLDGGRQGPSSLTAVTASTTAASVAGRTWSG